MIALIENVEMISISVVSHGQFQLVRELLNDIEQHCQGLNFELILTLNLPETVDVHTYTYAIQIIENLTPKGFGENHNAAFRVAKGRFFCVVNPDVRLTNNVFNKLLAFHKTNNPGISAPIVINSTGNVEDSGRNFPSPMDVFYRALGIPYARKENSAKSPSQPDWVAGMFMLFNSSDYRNIGGFDERYFLYYEDVDICARLTLKGRSVLLCKAATVIHDAQRSSHKNLKYLRWHISSMLRFFFSINYLRLLCR